MLILIQQVRAVSDSARPDSIVVESPLPGGAAAIARFFFNTVPQWVQIAGVFVGAAVAIGLLVFIWRRREKIIAWFSAKSHGWKLGFAAIVLVLVGGVGAAGYKTWRFMMHDNGFCTGCHVMKTPFQRFATSTSHGKLLCHDCHRQGMVANVRQLYQWVAERPERIGMHAPVPNAVCNECHVQRNADSAWKRISATAGHQVHLNPRSPAMRQLSCVTCHGKEVHRFKSTENNCAQSGCHDRVKIQLGKMAAAQTQLHCTMCHQFSAASIETNPVDSARAAMIPARQQCLDCHQMQQRMTTFRPEADPHKGECGLCHNPHTQTTTSGAYQSCATSGCHARSDTLTSRHRGLVGRHKLETCGACHVAHTWKAGKTDCTACHSGISDPAVQVRPRRPAGAGAAPVGPFFPLGDGADPDPTALGAIPLPERPPPHHAVPAPDSARFTHDRHRSVSCTTCHTSDVAHGSLRTSVARRCTACHHGNSASGQACARCHEPAELAAPHAVPIAIRIAASPAPASRSLTFEHRRHATIACAQCHAATLARTVTTTCTSCHVDHHQASRTCASCHPPVLATHTRAVHLTGCGGAGCHAAETTPATTPVRSVCVACHVQQADHKPGRDCAACHLTRWRALAGTGGA